MPPIIVVYDPKQCIISIIICDSKSKNKYKLISEGTVLSLSGHSPNQKLDILFFENDAVQEIIDISALYGKFHTIIISFDTIRIGMIYI